MMAMGRRSREKTGPYIPRVYIRELREARELSLAGLLKRVADHGVQLTPASLSRVERSLQPVERTRRKHLRRLFLSH